MDYLRHGLSELLGHCQFTLSFKQREPALLWRGSSSFFGGPDPSCFAAPTDHFLSCSTPFRFVDASWFFCRLARAGQPSGADGRRRERSLPKRLFAASADDSDRSVRNLWAASGSLFCCR